MGRECSLFKENLCAGGISGLGAAAVGTGIILEVRRKISLFRFSIRMNSAYTVGIGYKNISVIRTFSLLPTIFL